MAPFAGSPPKRLQQSSQMNGLSGVQDAPPSTLAANLANNLSSNRRPSKNEEREDFQRLLLEMSKQEGDSDTANSQEALTEHHHKLIYVVAKAVLEVLIKDNGLFNDQLLQQASEGLDILIVTIKETPEVLAHVAGQDAHLQSGKNVPLWLWLFPRILALVGRPRCDILQEKITEFFRICFWAVSRSLQFGALNSSFFLYFRHCTDTTLESLRKSITAPSFQTHTLDLVLPFVTIQEDIAIQDNPDLLSEGCTYVLANTQHALRHSCYLLALIVDVSSSVASSSGPTLAFQGHLAWILDAFLLLRETESTWGLHTTTQQSEFQLCALSVHAVHRLLTSLVQLISTPLKRKGYSILTHLCAELVNYSGALSETAIQTVFCSSLLDLAVQSAHYETVAQAVRAVLLPALENLMENELASGLLSVDIQQSIAILRRQQRSQSFSDEVALSSLTEFQTSSLAAQLRYLGLDQDKVESDESRPSKRRRTFPKQEILSEVVKQVYLLLGSQNASDLDGLEQIATACFAQLENADRCKAIEYLGYIPCASVGTLKLTRDRSGNICDAKCSICDFGKVEASTIYDENTATTAIKTFTTLLSIPEFEESRRPRLIGMLALRAFAIHFKDPVFLNLETSILGQWCIKSLRSSIRELRITAGRTLPAFLREGIQVEILHKNKKNALDFLHILSESNPPHLTETCILAWGQIGRISEDRELSRVLLRLVEYLGHTNQIASGVAFNEILNISKVFGIPVGQLFRPFWRDIGLVVVKDLQTRPQTAQLTADLLGISVSELLLTIQADVLPWLVLGSKKDIIMRIAQARKDDDPGATCLEASNMGPILALLLMQNVTNLENFVLTSLRKISPLFNGWEFIDLLKSGPMLIAVELLKNAGEEDDGKKSRVRHALSFLASHASATAPDSTYSKRGNQIGPFLETHILPIMFHFSDLLNDTLGWHGAAEKRRSLKGIEEMLRVGKGYIRSALPQICASLQSALANDEIRSTAFSAWKTMVKSLDDEDVGPMLETTFSIIILNWNSFDDASRMHANELIGHILKQRRDLFREFIDVIPSLKGIHALANYEKELQKLRKDLGIRQRYRYFCQRIDHEHESVVVQALLELKAYLRQNQVFLQASAASEQPDSVVGELLRSILDACVKFNGDNHEIARLSAECIGQIGCLDSNRVEAVRPRKEIVVISNFDDSAETTDFVLFVLEQVIVKAFLSTKNPRTQSFLSYAMQELLEKCDVKSACLDPRKLVDHNDTESVYHKWLSLPESVRQTLTPFLRSSYSLTEMARVETKYPIFEPKKNYMVWLRAFVLDLLRQPSNTNAIIIFEPLSRVIKIEDISVANFLLPYVVLHVIVLGTDQQRQNIHQELLRVLAFELSGESHIERTNLKLCSEAVFRILDYTSQWVQEKQANIRQNKGYDSRWSHPDEETLPPEIGIERVQSLLSSIPAEVISHRAVECQSYSRALFHWEQHIRQVRETASNELDMNPLLERLQEIYTQIDEPDGIEGISAHLHVLDIDQQILGHRKAGRWTAAQTWYEIKLAEEPDDVDIQVSLLHCLKESGQHDVLLNYVEGMHKTSSAVSKLLPFAIEASWATGRWDTLQKYLSQAPQATGGDFNIGVGRILLAMHQRDFEGFDRTIAMLREQIACSLSPSTTSSLGACHDVMLKCHVLAEFEMLAEQSPLDRKELFVSLDRRLEAIGAYLNDKQYLLGIRRAVMQLRSPPFTRDDVASAWLTSARLARKGNSSHQSFNAVLHASQLGDPSATIEHARLLWKEGHHRKAIQSLQGAIDTNAFISHNRGPVDGSTSFTDDSQVEQQNLLTARAHLLLAKWLDSAGHTHSSALRSQYQLAAKKHSTWEKGHYYLGRHYNKLLESEKALPLEQQAQTYLIGETARLVIENYLRSLSYGTKYIYQTLPRVITLWLDLGTQVNQPVDSKYGTREFISKITAYRKEQLAMLHNRFAKYIQKFPAYIFYTALPQIVARITHPNDEVYQYLQQIIVKVVAAHPQQALWTLLAVSTSTQQERKTRGLTILANLRNVPRKVDTGTYDLKNLIKSGERLATQLLMVCNAGDFRGNRTIKASITRDLGFNHKMCTPSPLCVPIESALTATLPTLTDNIRAHKAFSRDVVTISQFLDEVLVLSSLQKPRKLTARGSDGKNYGLLCKPKDDLRKDQRLMEFNSMINRSLKRDAESSKRQLYIKTYAVTPLNEECGIIEWVDGLKTLRDILLNLYKLKGITPNYGEIKVYLDEACKSDDKLPLFTEKLLGNTFPPVFHSWFVLQFPEPSAWFVARLKYTRSCAVMSMVGTILGLGDRHGENILFEEGNGGTFHVDFNCLFDKGLTFAQPERVPFRLTHNMVDAMGIYGYEGPFRKSAELTLRLLRQHEETLMTILEAFVYDPTLDLLAKKSDRKKKDREGVSLVPDTAQGVLDGIRRKVRGLLAGESVPLGVEGQVDELIKQAVNPKNLAAMYIGWCAFF